MRAASNRVFVVGIEAGALLLAANAARAQPGVTFGATRYADEGPALAERLPIPHGCLTSAGLNACVPSEVKEAGGYRAGPWIPWRCDPTAGNTVTCHVNLPGGEDDGAITSDSPRYGSVGEARKHPLPIPPECIDLLGKNQCVEEINGVGQDAAHATWQLSAWIWKWSAVCRLKDGSVVGCGTADSTPMLPDDAHLAFRYPAPHPWPPTNVR
jgi:hypothetical protein